MKAMKYFKEDGRRKKVENFLLISFVALIVVDAVLAAINSPFPTFSRLFVQLSPDYFFLIIFLGIVTINFFFPIKKRNEIVPKKYSIVILLLIFGVSFFLGQKIQKAPEDCETFLNYQPKFYLQKFCYADHFKSEKEDIDYQLYKVPCPDNAMACDNYNDKMKVDFKVLVKLSFFFFGMIIGFLLWPQFKITKNKPTII